MDPDAALEAIRDAIRFVEMDSAPTNFYAIDDLIALDEWLSNGGFLPKAWQQHNNEGDQQ